jgi:hypothetical protein
MSNRGWYPRHRNVLNLLDSGELTLLDSAIEDFLYLIADYRTGLAKASAEKIRALCPRGIDLRAIQRSLARLESLGRIVRYQSVGRRGNYPVLLCHYFVRELSGKWKRVNAANTKSWTEIKYDYVTDPSSLAPEVVITSDTTLSSLADGGDTRRGTEVTPIQEEEQEPENRERSSQSNFEVESECEIESESSELREKLPAAKTAAVAIADALADWDMPPDRLLRIGPDLLATLYVDAARLRPDENCKASLANMKRAWSNAWRRLSTGTDVVKFIEAAKEKSNGVKMWIDPVFLKRCAQIERGELKVTV